MSRHLLCCGLGYTANALVPHLQEQGWQISATLRNPQQQAALQARHIRPLLLPPVSRPASQSQSEPIQNKSIQSERVPVQAEQVLAQREQVLTQNEQILMQDKQQGLTADMLAGVTHILLSAPPTADGDPILPLLRTAPAGIKEQIEWVGYLSTTGVYGDHDGRWIDETTLPQKLSVRGTRRRQAEADWAATGLPVHNFRLAGIYGPHRNSLRALQEGRARRIDKPGQVFSRIHIADIVNMLMASIAQPRPGRSYNVCDDMPAPPQEVVSFAAQLMGVSPPPLVAFDDADMSPMARSFYSENKRVSNRRIKQELGVELIYPDYRKGLTALWESGHF